MTGVVSGQGQVGTLAVTMVMCDSDSIIWGSLVTHTHIRSSHQMHGLHPSPLQNNTRTTPGHAWPCLDAEKFHHAHRCF